MRTETMCGPVVSDAVPGGRPIRHLLIISRYHPGLFEYVRTRFAGEDNVEVILDRRRGRDRRSNATTMHPERRSADRRVRQNVDDALRMESMQFVTIARGVVRSEPCSDAAASSDQSV